MTTTPLPPPVPLTGIDCYIDPKDGKVKRYDQARADLEAEVKRLREALKTVQAAIYMDDAGQLRLTKSFDESVIDAALENTK